MNALALCGQTVVASLGIVSVVSLFLALGAILGFGICNDRFDGVLKLLGVVELPLWSVGVLIWVRLRRNRSRGADESTP